MAADPSKPDASSSTLTPRLGAFDAVMMVAGCVVGVGIFVTPSEVARILRSPRAILLAWVLGGVAAMMGGIACSKLGRFLPRAGGLYVYLREAYHPAVAFLYGWTVLLAIFSGVTAAVSLTFARYAAVLLPPLLGWERTVAGLLVAMLAWVNYRGIRLSGDLQNLLAVAKLAGIALLALLALMTTGTEAIPAAGPAPDPGAFLFALLPVFMSYGGWYTLTFLAADVRRPERNLPVGIVGGLAIAIAVYALINAAYMRVLTVAEIAESPAVASAMAERVVGRAAAGVIAGLVILSAPGVVNVVILSGSRLYYAMARDGLFFESAARLHPRYGSPAWSIAAQAGWSMALLVSHTYGQLLQWSMFGEWTFFALVGASVHVFAARRRDFYRGSGERVLVGASAAGFTAMAVAVVGSALYQSPRQSLLGVGLILAGLPAYQAWRRARPAQRALDSDDRRGLSTTAPARSSK
jgi:APA family basic amino acid/polyamine antiporter